MERVAQTIASNAYLQAVAILVALVTAVLFLWKNRTSILGLFKAIISFLFGKIWIPVDTTIEHIKLGKESPSFLISVIAKHAVSVFLCFFGWYICRDINLSLRKLEDPSSLVEWVSGSLIVLTNVFVLVGGARLGEISSIAKGVIFLSKKDGDE
jgi:hypothetical protein